MPKSESQEKFFEALSDSYEAIIEAVKAGNERGYRFSKTLIEEAEKGQKEALELGKKWAAAPTDAPGLLGSLVEAMAKAQSRGLVLARDWLGELSESRTEVRDAFQRVVSANQAAAQAAVEAARGVVTSATEAARPSARRARQGGSDSGSPASTPESTSAPSV